MDQDMQTSGNAVSGVTNTGAASQSAADTSVQSLEQELKDIMPTASPKQEGSSFETKAAELEQTRKTIDQKVVSLETDIRQKLANLKELRAAIEEEMQKIKELKEAEQKIDSGLEKIKKLQKEHEEVENEIQAIEQTTKLAA